MSVRATRAFFQQVYEVVETIPEGKVSTYGTLALALGLPGRARQVGTALAALPDHVSVPAHRVVNRSGVLTGEHAFGPPGIMRALLENEGVSFLEDGRVDLSRHLWDPPALPLRE